VHWSGDATAPDGEFNNAHSCHARRNQGGGGGGGKPQYQFAKENKHRSDKLASAVRKQINKATTDHRHPAQPISEEIYDVRTQKFPIGTAIASQRVLSISFPSSPSTRTSPPPLPDRKVRLTLLA
jgi:hypothetical protein